MDFAPVPAGTLPPVALTLRGGDPDVEAPAASAYIALLGDAHHARNAAGNRKAVDYSSVAGTVVNYLFTADPAVLSLGVSAEAIGPARLDAAFAFLTQNMSGGM